MAAVAAVADGAVAAGQWEVVARWEALVAVQAAALPAADCRAADAAARQVRPREEPQGVVRAARVESIPME